jgi:hypothetical protein
MTGRVCPVHGEYAADGICRWCEPEDAAHLEALHVPLYAEVPPPGDLTEAMVGLSERLPPTSPTMYETTFTLTEKTEEAYVWRLEWTGLDVAKILRTYQPEYLARIGFKAIYCPTPADLPIQPPVVLEYQHAALRWERVARRWATKAKFDGHERTVDGTLAFDDRCAECRRTRPLTDAGLPKEWP